MSAQLLRIANLVQPNIEHHTYMRVPDTAVRPGFASDWFELAMPISFRTDTDQAMAAVAFAEAGLRAEREGYAAAIVNAFGDYGMQTLRSLVSIPVVGAGQASLHAALALGRKFGIVTVWPRQTRPTYDRLLAENGFESRSVGVRFATTAEDFAGELGNESVGLRLASRPETLIDRIELHARLLLDDGADVLVVGCCCMTPICAALEERLGVPVINPVTAAQAYAEMLVTLGARVRRPPVPAEQAQALRAMVSGGAVSDAYGEPECGDACAVEAPDPAAVLSRR